MPRAAAGPNHLPPLAHTLASPRLSACPTAVCECAGRSVRLDGRPIIGKSPKDLLRADPTQPFPLANTNSNTSPGSSPVVGQPPASLQYFLEPSISRASLGRTNRTFADAPRILCCCLWSRVFASAPVPQWRRFPYCDYHAQYVRSASPQITERSTLRDIRPIRTIAEPAVDNGSLIPTPSITPCLLGSPPDPPVPQKTPFGSPPVRHEVRF